MEEKFKQYKNELNVVRKEVEEKNNYIHEIEQDNSNLHNEIESSRHSSNDEMNQNVDRLREIVGRIDGNLHNGENH